MNCMPRASLHVLNCTVSTAPRATSEPAFFTSPCRCIVVRCCKPLGSAADVLPCTVAALLVAHVMNTYAQESDRSRDPQLHAVAEAGHMQMAACYLQGHI